MNEKRCPEPSTSKDLEHRGLARFIHRPMVSKEINKGAFHRKNDEITP
jgi:hypothetical protein